jgi:hypothetical protein
VLAKERFARYVCFLCVGAYSVWHSIQWTSIFSWCDTPYELF